MRFENGFISRSVQNARGGARVGANVFRKGWILLLVAAFLAQPAFVQPAFSQSAAPTGPMPTWTIETVDGPRYFTNMTDRSLAYKPNATPCAAYGGDGLYYACFNSTTEKWNVTVVDDSLAVGQYAALTFYTVPGSGITDAFISYYDDYNGELKLAYTFMGTWQAPITVPNPAVGALTLNPDMLADPVEAGLTPVPEDLPSFEGELKQFQPPALSVLQERDPSFPIKTTKGVGLHTSIAANSEGVYISYYDDREIITNLADPRCVDATYPANICERNLKVAFWNGVSWHIDLVDDYGDQGAVGLWSSIKVDYTGNLHVAYMSEKYDTLKYAFWNHAKNSWVKETVDGGYPSQVGAMCSIALDDTNVPGDRGVPYISYLDISDRHLRLAKFNPGPDTWSKLTIDTEFNTGWYTSIALGSEDKVYISYYDASDGDLKHATGKISTDFTITTLLRGQGKQGLFSSIALGIDDKSAILHLNASTAQMQFTAYKTKTTWTTRVVDSGRDVGYASSLAISPTGWPHISYLDATQGNLKYATLGFDSSWATYHPVFGPHQGLYNSIDLFGEMPRVGSYDSDGKNLVYGKLGPGPWSFQYITKKFDVGQHVSMAIDSNDKPHFSYYDADEQNLMYGTWNALTSKWFTDTLDITGDVGQFTSIVLSSDDRAYISYYDASFHNLKVAYQSPPFKFWVIDVVDGGPPNNDKVGMYSSIALDNAGNPHVTYYDETYRNPKYAYWNGANWVPETIPDPNLAGEVGTYTSLAIYTADNSSHVCYYDKTTGGLRYARFSGIWEFDTVDDLGDVGYSCSIDLTTAGEPAITYYNNSRSDLMIAYSYTLPTWAYSIFLPIIGTR